MTVLLVLRPLLRFHELIIPFQKNERRSDSDSPGPQPWRRWNDTTKQGTHKYIQVSAGRFSDLTCTSERKGVKAWICDSVWVLETTSEFLTPTKDSRVVNAVLACACSRCVLLDLLGRGVHFKLQHA